MAVLLDEIGLLFKTSGCTKGGGLLNTMPSRSVLLKVSTLLLKAPNAIRMFGVLGSMPAANAALVYLFIVLSKIAPFCQRIVVSPG